MSKSLLMPIAACLLAVSGCSKKEQAETAEIAPVQVTSVTQQNIRRMVTGDGVLYPINQASVVPNITKSVQKFLVNRGDHVKAGHLVAVLEHGDLAAAVNAARGQLNQAEANYRSTSAAAVPEAVTKAITDVQADEEQVQAAQKLVESRRKLFQDGALARRQVDEAQVAYAQGKAQLEAAQEHLRTLQNVGKQEQVKTAEAQVESAKAQYQSAQAQLAYSEIHSPINGVVSDRPLYAGEMAAAGTPLLTIVDISRVVARVNIAQAQAATVKVGDPAVLTQTESGLQVDGKVTVVSPATDPASTTVQVWIEAANPREEMKPGTSVHAVIVTQLIKNASVVPVAAILPGEEGGTSVLTVSADSRAHRRKVELGVREGDKVQILSGAAPGEEVIISGGVGVDDKAKVKVLAQPEEAEDEDETAEPPEKPNPAADAKKDEAKPKAK
jgi:multidrug efflux pump subunit AcrA (membrane-fusion protein)